MHYTWLCAPHHADALRIAHIHACALSDYNNTTVPFRPNVQSCVTSDPEMNVPGISSGVTASSEQFHKSITK
jgi:hypothetical protein